MTINEEEMDEVSTQKESSIWVLVHTLRTKNGLTLVEWTEAGNRLRRSWITAEMMDEKTVSGKSVMADRPERGIPFGDDFANAISFKADPQAFEDELHRRGVWTYEDVKLVDVQVALQHAYGSDYSQLFYAMKQKRNTNNQEN